MISFVWEVNIKFTVQERQVYHGVTVYDLVNSQSCGKQSVLIVHVFWLLNIVNGCHCCNGYLCSFPWRMLVQRNLARTTQPARLVLQTEITNVCVFPDLLAITVKWVRKIVINSSVILRSLSLYCACKTPHFYLTIGLLWATQSFLSAICVDKAQSSGLRLIENSL